jgi:prepilin-type N-terminal cleavage/methylation domain-containing protein
MSSQKRNHACASSKGFTLIELLVVISIIGLLASIVLASLNSARAKGRYAQMVADMDQIRLAVELDADNRGGVYPPDGSACAPPSFAGGTIPVWPKPPCPGWGYDYENWGPHNAAAEMGTEVIVRISVRTNCPDNASAAGPSVLTYCIYGNQDCIRSTNLGFHGGVDVFTLSPKELACY